MIVNTVVFGPSDIREDALLRMPRGPYGFDEHRTFALIEQEDDGMVFRWLQSVDSLDPCFVVFDPDEIVMGYAPRLERADLDLLGCKNEAELKYYAIAVVPEDYTKTTINLKSPVAVNPRTGIAMQVILMNTDYPVRFPLATEPELAAAVGG